MAEWDERLTDNSNSFEEHMCGYTYAQHTHARTLQLFIGILGPPTFLLRRLIVAGCVALHTRGKHNGYYLLRHFLKVVGFIRRIFAFVHVFTTL